ncbi:MAG: 4Fe-4S binding protein [Deltaproteobacteria bacterium]|nr:4Fe-4S binding protein [Deltaproteobacteria bacterium]
MILHMLRAMGETMRNVIRPPVTMLHPFQKRTRPPRARATFALLHNEHGEEACIGCLMCENICPSQVISIKALGKKESPVTGKKRGYIEDFTLNLQACIFCELCVQVCPEDAITMCRTQEIPGFSREDLVLTKDKLFANEKLEKAWGIGSRFVEMHDTKYGLPKPPPGAEGEVPAKPAKVAKPKPAEVAPAASVDAAKPVEPPKETPPPPAGAKEGA